MYQTSQKLTTGNKLLPLQNHGVQTMSIGYLLRNTLFTETSEGY